MPSQVKRGKKKTSIKMDENKLILTISYKKLIEGRQKKKKGN